MHANPYIGVKVWLGGIIKNNLTKKMFEDWWRKTWRKTPQKNIFSFSYCYIYVTKGFDYLQAKM
jgi:hypothetical protein